MCTTCNYCFFFFFGGVGGFHVNHWTQKRTDEHLNYEKPYRGACNSSGWVLDSLLVFGSHQLLQVGTPAGISYQGSIIYAFDQIDDII